MSWVADARPAIANPSTPARATAGAAIKIVEISVRAGATAHHPAGGAGAADALLALAAPATRAGTATLAAIRRIGGDVGADGVPPLIGRARLQTGSAHARGARACTVEAVVAAAAAVVVLGVEVCAHALVTIGSIRGMDVESLSAPAHLAVGLQVGCFD